MDPPSITNAALVVMYTPHLHPLIDAFPDMVNVVPSPLTYRPSVYMPPAISPPSIDNVEPAPLALTA